MKSAPNCSTTPATANARSRSLHNIAVFFSHGRPNEEFCLKNGSDWPESLSSAKDRIKRNMQYFRANYFAIFLMCLFVSLLYCTTPVGLVLTSGIMFLWLVLYYFREDPSVFWDRPTGDRWKLGGLVLIFVFSSWSAGILWHLMIGFGIGVVIVALHGFFRNADGLFLEESEAVSTGLIGSGPSLNQRDDVPGMV